MDYIELRNVKTGLIERFEADEHGGITIPDGEYQPARAVILPDGLELVAISV